MPRLPLLAALLALVLSGAIFGFFYAWTVSTMWGLDQADPRVAIAAMQAMNASVRNMAFAPAFFGTGPALLLAAALAFSSSHRAALLFTGAALTYIIAAMALTMAVNVPMNEELARTAIPADSEKARQIWQAYSSDWQVWNQIRTATSGLAFGLGLWGLVTLARH